MWVLDIINIIALIIIFWCETHPETLLNESNSTLLNHYRQHFKGHDFQRVCTGGLESNNRSKKNYVCTLA